MKADKGCKDMYKQIISKNVTVPKLDMRALLTLTGRLLIKKYLFLKNSIYTLFYTGKKF